MSQEYKRIATENEKEEKKKDYWEQNIQPSTSGHSFLEPFPGLSLKGRFSQI